MSLLRVIGGLISDTVARNVRLDPATNCLATVDYPHHETHEGDAYFIDDAAYFALDYVRDFQIITPNTLKWAHLQFTLLCESETEIWLYEGVTIVTPGTAVTPRNRNRNSSNTSGLTVYSQGNSSIANANSDTTIASATTLLYNIAGSGRGNPGSGTTREEYILKQNTAYSLRLSATAAGYVNHNISWYEHTSID